MATSLLDLPHCEARRLLATGAPVYLTVNPVEYHGPHLSLHNDRLIARGLAQDIHAQTPPLGSVPMLLADDLEVGAEPVPGLGSREIHYQVTRTVVLEACRALAELGARGVVLMTFHGAPLHNLALQAGVDWLTAHGVRAVAPFHVILRELIQLDDFSRFDEGLAPIADDAERRAMAAELTCDFHAGYFETSVAMHYAPASVSPTHRTLPPCPPITPEPRLRAAARAARALGRQALASELDYAARGVAWAALRPFPGYTGRPHLANPRAGAFFARQLVDVLAPVVEGVLSGRSAPPPPIMPWLDRLSAGGRLGSMPRPAPATVAELEAAYGNGTGAA